MRGNLTLDYQQPGFVSGPALGKKISPELQEALDIIEIYSRYLFSGDDEVNKKARRVYADSVVSLHGVSDESLIKYADELVLDHWMAIPEFESRVEDAPPEKGAFDSENRARLQRIADERNETIVTQFGEIRPSDSLVFDGSDYFKGVSSGQQEKFFTMAFWHKPEPIPMDGMKLNEELEKHANGHYGFKPDFVWVKKQDDTPLKNFAVFDSVRSAVNAGLEHLEGETVQAGPAEPFDEAGSYAPPAHHEQKPPSPAEIAVKNQAELRVFCDNNMLECDYDSILDSYDVRNTLNDKKTSFGAELLESDAWLVAVKKICC